MITALDALLFGVAILIMAVGFSRRADLWQRGREETCSGDLWGVIRYILGHGRIMSDRKRGLPHLILVTGIVIPLFVAFLEQFGLQFSGPISGLLSLFLDLLGTAFLVCVLVFLAQRMKTVFPLLLLFLVGMTGFLAEGARLSIISRGFQWESPVGWSISLLLPSSPLTMQVLIRVHFFLVLLLAASLPFTFLRHVAGATLNVFYRRRERPAQLRPAHGEGYLGAGHIEDFSWKQLLEAEACVSCGRCEENCPATTSGKTLSPKAIMQGILHQMEAAGPSRLLEDEISAGDIWSCTTCMACVEHCPVFVEPVDKILDMRRYLVTGKAMLPVEARPMIRNVEIFGDVHGKGLARRADWAFHRDVPLVSATGQEVLLWVGCAGAFHPRYQETVRAMVKVLKAAGVRFGILGKEESCCGDPVRRLGDERLFQDLARRNIERMSAYAFHEILVLCPHCFNTLKNEYPALGGSFPVVHSAEFIARLIQDQRITLKYPLPATLTIHDPCYLGRGNGIYEPLRDIGRHVPGVHLKELTRNREKGFCCGAGGGRMWLHETGGRRINQLRAEEIRDSAVDMVATACPYCLTMMEDGIGSLELQRPPKVRDMVEIVADALGC